METEQIGITCSKILRDETWDEHEFTERLLVERLKAIDSTNDYIQFLKIFYGFFHPLESLISPYITCDVLDDLGDRRNSARLLHDLQTLGYRKPVPVSPYMPSVTNTRQALGALYVAEGSTLGGSVIAKSIRRNNAIKDGNAAVSFFDGYGDTTMIMWRRFQIRLDSIYVTRRDIDDVVFAAKKTFHNMSLWIQSSDKHF